MEVAAGIDILWLPLAASALVCGCVGYVAGYLTGERAGCRQGLRLGRESRGRARHEAALRAWEIDRPPDRWAAATQQEGRLRA